MNQILHNPVDMFIIGFIVTMILIWGIVIPILVTVLGVLLFIWDRICELRY